VIAFITERTVVKAILEHLGLPTTGPPLAPARSTAPPELAPWQDDVPTLQHPRRQRRQERALHGIFHRFEVGKPHAADQYRHQPAVLVPEVVFHQTRR
jgi:hypothetical protein